MPFAIEVKHDKEHTAWNRLSAVAITPEGLVADLEPHIRQYAADHQMNPDMIAGRVVEIEVSQIGAKASGGHTRIVLARESNAAANRP